MKRVYIYIMCSLLAISLHAQDGFGTYLRDVIQKQEKGIFVTAKLIEACGLCDSLDLLMDYKYEHLYQSGMIQDMENYMEKSGYDMSSIPGDPNAYAPEHRRYGYTVFAETDDFWEQQLGKSYKDITVADVKNYVVSMGLYPNASNDDQFDDEDNVLNLFVTYHMLPRRVPIHKLVIHSNELGYSISRPFQYTLPVYEHYITMGKRRLLRTYESLESNGIYINRFPRFDNGIYGSGHEISCDPDKAGILIDTQKAIPYANEIPNAIIYPIEQLLAYTEDVRNNFANVRSRYDIAGLFREFTTNDIRRADSSLGKYQHVYIPNNYQYMDDLTMSQETYFIYYNGYKTAWANYCQDEIKAFGHFDVTLRLPPVPKAGEYELRYKVLATAARGIVQVYFGTDKDALPPAGMPFDFTKNCYDYLRDNLSWSDISDSGKDEYEIQQIENELREHNVMKAARFESEMSTTTARDKSNCVRLILVRQMMDPDQTYYVRFKTVQANLDRPELYMDYIELCPKAVYDNPYVPEDIW